jgi:L-malate glycosyltransferase
MRVLHIATYLQGGAGRAITDLVLAQHQRGDDVTLVASMVGEPGFENYPEYLDRLRQAGVRVHLVDSTFKRDLHRVMTAFDTIRREWPVAGDSSGMVHAHAAVPSIVGLLLAGTRHAVRVVQTMHGWARGRQPEHVIADVHAMNALRGVAVPSAAAREQLIEAGVATDRVRIIPYGLPERVHDESPDPDIVRTAETWRAQGRSVVICIGSVGARKNQRALLDAVAADGVRGTVGVIVIGEGDLDGIRAHSRTLAIEDAVYIAGYRERAARHLAVADWLALPSTREGLPLAVLEAFRANCPVIVTGLPELLEAVTPDTGLAVAPNDERGLAAALREAHAMTPAARAAMGRRARARWEAAYRLETMVAGYDGLYHDAVI